jgi:hypothetical protein
LPPCLYAGANCGGTPPPHGPYHKPNAILILSCLWLKKKYPNKCGIGGKRTLPCKIPRPTALWIVREVRQGWKEEDRQANTQPTFSLIDKPVITGGFKVCADGPGYSSVCWVLLQITISLKLKITKIVTLPVALYGCGTWTLTLRKNLD